MRIIAQHRALFTVTQPPLLVTTDSVTNVKCAGGNAGSINLTVNGGTQPYVFSWNNGSTTQNIGGLVAGVYSVTVVDAHGCSNQLTISVNTSYTLVINTAATNATCGNNNGFATVAVTGGSGSYSYLWGNGATTDTIGGLAAGVYNVTVTDLIGGCIRASFVAVSNVTPISISDSITNVNCVTGVNGRISLTVSGGTPPYTYLWSNGATTSIDSNLVAGAYSVTVRDSSGCSANAGFNVRTSSGIALTITTQDAHCGSNDGSITVVPSGNGGFTYTWSNGHNGITNAGLSAGVYSLTVSDTSGCVTDTVISVSNINGPVINIDTVINITCSR